MTFADFSTGFFSTTSARSLLNRMTPTLSLRQRYVLTRRNTLRLRYIALPALLALALAGGASEIAINHMLAGASYQVAANDDPNFVPAPYEEDNDQADDATATASAAIALPAGQVKTAAAQPTQAQDKTVKIGKGDTLGGVLEKAGVSSADAFSAMQALKPYYNPRSLTVGQKVSLHFEPVADTGTYNFARLSVPLDVLSTVHLNKNPAGNFVASVDKKEAIRKVYARRAQINSSLYGSAMKSRIPNGIVANAIKIYSWDVDFQRDIQPGDSIDVMYDQYETADGNVIRSGDILYAKLTVDGQDMPIYRYKTKDGDVDYFTPKGVSVRKALLSTPVDGARISSGFGARVHPVLGYTKMHKGIDFAAPIGTPIYAAGNGTIEKAGPFSTYGNYIRIRHNSTLKTAYAHMLRFATGIRSGSHVHQGEVIGYIGTTGRSTGAHLHYEILINNAQVNPRTVKVQQGEPLSGPQMVAFKTYIKDIQQRYTAALSDKFASLSLDKTSLR